MQDSPHVNLKAELNAIIIRRGQQNHGYQTCPPHLAGGSQVTKSPFVPQHTTSLYIKQDLQYQWGWPRWS